MKTAGLRRDVVFAWRQLARSPLRTVTAVVTLAVGQGLTGTAISTVRSLQTLPAPGIPRNPRLVRIRGVNETDDGQRYGRLLSMPEVSALAGQRDVLAGVAAWTAETVPVGIGVTTPAPVVGISYVTDDFFPVLGVRFVLGRAPLDPGEGAISYDYWRTRLGEDSTVLGRILRVDGHATTVVGVGAPGFRGPNARATPTVAWLPLAARAINHAGRAGALAGAGPEIFSVVAHLAPGVSLSEASASAQLVARRLQRTHPDTRFVAGSEVVPLLAANDTPIIGTDVALAVLSGVGLLILLVVCVTVSTLLAGSAVARRREIGVRLALGASRKRVVRLLLSESLLLAAAGAVAGALLLAVTWPRVAAAFDPATLTLDPVTMLSCCGLVLGVGILSGLAPALNASKTSIAGVLQETAGSGTRARLRLQRRLVVAQVALTQPLLLGLAVLLQVALGDARDAMRTPGADYVVVIRFDRIGATAPHAERIARLRRARERIAALPGVTTVVTQPDGFHAGRFVPVDGTRDGALSAGFTARVHDLDPGYLPMMSARVVLGRGFVSGDSAVMLVGSELAHAIWGNTSPVGQRVRQELPGGEAFTIIGVVDARGTTVGETGLARNVYLPVVTAHADIGIFHAAYVRTIVPAARMVAAVSSALHAEIPGISVTSASTLESLQRQAERQRVMLATLATVAGIVALLLASVGLLATGALAVAERTREIGIRTALGAQPGRLVREFYLVGARLAGIGLALGLPLSMLTLRWLVPVREVPTAVPALATALAVAAVASLAAYVPAARAGRADPVVALRRD